MNSYQETTRIPRFWALAMSDLLAILVGLFALLSLADIVRDYRRKP